ncbi:MAG: hypothetical protein K1X75_05200 [Leptospirales bacterium]|nr:hypothetical protein [Leptospirales bacterium]
MSLRRLSCCCIFIACALQAQPASGVWPESDPRRLVQSGPDSRVDWSNGAVYARATVELPHISANGAPGERSASSLTDARAIARSEAREKAALRLMGALSALRLDGRRTLGERMHEDRELRERLGNLGDRFRVASRNTGEGQVTVTLTLPFLGAQGLYSVLARSSYASEAIPQAGPVDALDPISGLIVDLSEEPDFQPSLEPRIFTDRGRLIYGPEVVSRACAVRRGLAAYHSSVDRAREDRRVGQRPFYTFAGGILGPGRSDIYLDSEDVERILGHESGRTALRRCGVVIIVNPQNLKASAQ